MADSSGTTLMDLITADPSTISASTSSTTLSSSSVQSSAPLPPYVASPPPPRGTTLGTALGKPVVEKMSKRVALMQIQNDTISAAKAALNPVRTNIIMPQKHKHKQKKPVSYAQLARSIH